MKTKLFKSAWSIFRNTSNISFAEALTLAWEKIKLGLEAVVVKSNKLVKSAGLGYETVYFNELVYKAVAVVASTCNNSAAAHYYNGRTLNMD